MSSAWLQSGSVCHSDGIMNLPLITQSDEIPTPAKSSGWHTAVFISHPDEMRPGANSSGWLRVQITLSHSDDIGQYRHPDDILQCQLSHPDEIWPGANSSGWLSVQITLCHPNDLRKLSMSPGCHSTLVISHPNEIFPPAKSSEWLRDQTTLFQPDHIGHPHDILQLVRKSSGWDMTRS